MEGGHGGEQRVLQRDGEPLPSIDVVLVTANRNLSKLYYAKAYAEGDDDAPDCSSANGVTPDAGIPAPQAATCATCQHNVWGSKITERGKKTKACSDMRRLALIPERDMECKAWGAPLPLRVPPGSFQNLTEYARTALGGKEYCAVVTRIGFDMMAAYPKLTFRPMRWVTEAEAVIINRWRSDPIVGRIIGTDADPSAPNVQAGPSIFRPAIVVQAPVAPVPAQVAVPVAAPASSAAAADPFTQTAPPVQIRQVVPNQLAAATPTPPPAPIDPLAGVPEALKAAINAVGGPETAAGKAILATLVPAQPKRTRRSKAEMEAARAAPATPPTSAIVPLVGQGWVPPAPSPVSAIPAAIQGELVARAAPPAPPAPAPTGQEDLLAGVDALLAGLDNMPFDD
jgi:hypothetical protein